MLPRLPDGATPPQPADEVEALAAQFLAGLQAGEIPDREAVVRAHPHLADRLERRLALAEMIYRLGLAPEGSRPSNVATAPAPSRAPKGTGQTPTGLPAALWPAAAAGVEPRGVRRLGRYEVFEEIAQGGMGVVLRARDPELNRDLAVKVLRPGLRDCPEAVRRFVEEAQITAQLPHPGVVPVHDIGRDEQGLPFLVMKLVRGRTLEELLAGPRDEQARWLGVFEQVCQAVAFAHSRRVIHRDLKPSNVMVGRFGEVQVMDWGLAKVLTTASRGSQPPEISEVQTVRQLEAGAYTQGALGTPSYMAPEQAGGEWERVDERADVFGLGGILCAILTGRPPYEGTSREEVMGKALRGEVAGAFARLDGCGADAELVALAKECLSPEIAQRPGDAGAVARRVAAYQQGVQDRLRSAERERAAADARAEEAKATARVERARVQAERRALRRTVALVSVVVVAFAVGAGVAAWDQHERATRRARAESEAEGALGEAARLLHGEAEESSRDPERWQQTVSLAAAALQRAEAALATAAVNQELTERVGALRAQVEQKGRDSRLRVELDRIRLEETALKERRFDAAALVPRYRLALTSYGLDLGDAAAAAARVRASPLASELLAALRDCVRGTTDATERKRLAAVLQAADPDAGSWRRRWQQAAQMQDGPALAALARQAEARALPAADVVNLALDLQRFQEVKTAAELLRQGQACYPQDFWINHNLGIVLGKLTPPQREEAARYLTAAAALRSQSPGVWLNLGLALHDKGEIDAAIRCYRRAIDLNPGYADPYNNLGNALKEKGELGEAIRSLRRAIDLQPKLAPAHHNLGLALEAHGDVAGAIRCYTKAIDLDPKFAHPHAALGWVLLRKGKPHEAIRCLRRATHLDPKDALAHIRLGAAHWKKGEVDEAIRYFRRGLELDPRNPYAHYDLGGALFARGEFTAARQAVRRCLELVPPQDPNRHHALQRLRECEKAVVLSEKLLAVLRGEVRPTGAAETLELAQLCQRYQKRHVAAVRLYAEAFAAERRLAASMGAWHRYNAACCAALAAAGQGKDAQTLDARQKQRLRQQALDWLRADLDAWKARLADPSAKVQGAIRKEMLHWQLDTDLSSVRNAKQLAALPTQERDAWRNLWTDVAALLHKAHSPR
jgi:serine/threonine-protein kinase